MHIRRATPLIVVVALCSNCAAGERADAVDPMGRDTALIEQLRFGALEQDPASLPAACGPSRPATATAAQRAQARTLVQRARETEIVGDLVSARTLLRRAAELDATDKTSAYHLARVTEALGDRSEAARTYCRYLSLGPAPGDAAEVRERVRLLASSAPIQRQARHAAGGAARPAGSARSRPVVATRIRSAPPAVPPSPRGGRSAPVEVTASQPVATDDGQAPARPARDSVIVLGRDAASPSPVDESAGAGGVTPPAEQQSAPETDQAPRQTKRGAVLGAVVGAAAGAAIGRDVKGALIGAAAGGLLGAVVGHTVNAERP